MTALHTAVRYSKQDAVKTLLEAMADVNTQNVSHKCAALSNSLQFCFRKSEFVTPQFGAPVQTVPERLEESEMHLVESEMHLTCRIIHRCTWL